MRVDSQLFCMVSARMSGSWAGAELFFGTGSRGKAGFGGVEVGRTEEGFCEIDHLVFLPGESHGQRSLVGCSP